MKERFEWKNEVCNFLDEIQAEEISPQKNLHSLIYVEKLNFIWCPVPKAGSTFWVENLFNIAGIDETEKSRLRSEDQINIKLKVIYSYNIRETYLLLNTLNIKSLILYEFII